MHSAELHYLNAMYRAELLRQARHAELADSVSRRDVRMRGSLARWLHALAHRLERAPRAPRAHWTGALHLGEEARRGANVALNRRPG